MLPPFASTLASLRLCGRLFSPAGRPLRIICYCLLPRLPVGVTVTLLHAHKLRPHDAITVAVLKNKRPSRAAFGLQVGVVHKLFKFRGHRLSFSESSSASSSGPAIRLPWWATISHFPPVFLQT